MEVGGWVGPDLTCKKNWKIVAKLFYTSTDIFGKYTMCILYTLLKVDRHYD